MADNKPKRFRLTFVNAAEDIPRLVRAYGRACFGEFALVLRPAEGSGVMVRVTSDGARSWRAGGTDAPVLPAEALEPKQAVALVKAEQQAVPKPGPITLRGQWAGYLHCEDGTPRLELTRKLAAYGLLRLVSGPTGWTWTIERAAKWFSQPGADSGQARTLLGAIQAGLARAMGLLGEACSTRDSHRRAALDPTWAGTHPIRPAKEGKDPTERLKPKEPRRTRAATPPRMDAPVSLPDAPATARGVARMAEEIGQEADALAGLRDVSWVWHDSTALQDAAEWFRGIGLEHLAEDLVSYEAAPEQPPDRLLQHLRSHLAEIELDEETRKDANSVLDKLAGAFHTAPYVLERARRLVRHAARLTETELCRGQEQKEAKEAISRAMHAYNEARAAVSSGAPAEVRAKVRSMADWAALAAAKAARACAAGQTQLSPERASKKAEENKPPPARESSSKRRRASSEPKVEAPVAPESTRKARKGSPPHENPPAPASRSKKPNPAPSTPKKGPSPRKRSGKTPVGPDVDAEKDKLLLEAFKDAVSTAMSEVGPE